MGNWGNRITIAGTICGVSGKWRLESADALQKSEKKYHRLDESITDAVVAVDMAGHILEANPTFQSKLGYTGEELRRLTYQELTPERWHALEAPCEP